MPERAAQEDVLRAVFPYVMTQMFLPVDLMLQVTAQAVGSVTTETNPPRQRLEVSAEFEAFWQALVTEAQAALQPPVTIAFVLPVNTPGEFAQGLAILQQLYAFHGVSWTDEALARYDARVQRGLTLREIINETFDEIL